MHRLKLFSDLAKIYESVKTSRSANLVCGFDEQTVSISRGQHEIIGDTTTQITDPGRGGDFKELKE